MGGGEGRAVVEAGLPIPGHEALGVWARRERERGNQGYWREQTDFMVCLLALGMESTTFYILSTPLTLLYTQLHSR